MTAVPPFAPVRVDPPPHHLSSGRVEAGGGFIEEQHIEYDDTAQREMQSAFEPSRVGADLSINMVTKPGLFGELVAPNTAGPSWHTVQHSE